MLPIFRKKINQAISTIRFNQKKANNSDNGNVNKHSIPGDGNYVYKMEVVSKVSMYGYHDTPLNFVKIYLYFPEDVSKLANLLQVMEAVSFHFICLTNSARFLWFSCTYIIFHCSMFTSHIFYFPQETILGMNMQTYESHIPYLLKFTSDCKYMSLYASFMCTSNYGLVVS